MPIDHVNIRCSDMERARVFFEDVARLKSGERPDFSSPGYWLYDEAGQAVIHLVPAGGSPGALGTVDHVAFRFEDFDALTAQLAESGHDFSVTSVEVTQSRRALIKGPDGLQIELLGPLA